LICIPRKEPIAKKKKGKKQKDKYGSNPSIKGSFGPNRNGTKKPETEKLGQCAVWLHF